MSNRKRQRAIPTGTMAQQVSSVEVVLVQCAISDRLVKETKEKFRQIYKVERGKNFTKFYVVWSNVPPRSKEIIQFIRDNLIGVYIQNIEQTRAFLDARNRGCYELLELVCE